MSQAPARADKESEVGSAARPPTAKGSGSASVPSKGREPRTPVVTPAPASGSKRAAPEVPTPNAAKKGKAPVVASPITWQPDWMLKVDSAALGDEKLSMDFLTNAVLPLDVDALGAKTDAALLKSVAVDYYRVSLPAFLY